MEAFMRSLRCLILSVTLLPVLAARSERVVLPVAIFVAGANGSDWATEIRAANHTSGDLMLHVVDFVGASAALTFEPGDYVIPARQIKSFGAYNLVSPALAGCFGLACGVGVGNNSFGAFVIDLDAGVSMEAAILTGSGAFFSGGERSVVCNVWEGGYLTFDGPEACVEGAGPLLTNTGDFRAASTPIVLSWLHTQPSRRTNITFYNPDPETASVTLTVTSADGLSSANLSVDVPAHSVSQLNDIFATPPFDAVRAHNGTATAAASASLVSTTRLYAIGWVISNQNNTATISVPR
jgi:hypothetical protein